MRILENLKKVKKRWYILILFVLVVGGAGGAWEVYERSSQPVRVSEQIFTDLVYLESVPGFKLTPEQAKGILPLVNQLASAQDSKSQNDLERQIYASLNPSQYSQLIRKENEGNTLDSNRGDKGENDRGDLEDHKRDYKRSDREDFGREGLTDPKKEALKDIVIKMLQDRSGEKAAS